MEKTIYFDMDGTIANLYGVENWLDKLEASDPSPYQDAKPLVQMNVLARKLNSLKKQGYSLGVITWLSKNGTTKYNAKVKTAKLEWLAKHLKSVKFDEIIVTAYGVPKHTVCKNPHGILFDDNKEVRQAWTGIAFNVNNILGELKQLA